MSELLRANAYDGLQAGDTLSEAGQETDLEGQDIPKVSCLQQRALPLA